MFLLLLLLFIIIYTQEWILFRFYWETWLYPLVNDYFVMTWCMLCLWFTINLHRATNIRFSTPYGTPWSVFWYRLWSWVVVMGLMLFVFGWWTENGPKRGSRKIIVLVIMEAPRFCVTFFLVCINVG